MEKRYYCPVEVTVDAIGGKWKSRILWHLSHQTYRYGELNKLIPEISRKMLSQALRELEEDGLIYRTVIYDKIVKVEYDLTDYGKSLTPLLQWMSQWGKEHLERKRKEIEATKRKTTLE